MNEFIWIGYSEEPPYLPVAVADSARQLAQLMGTTKGAIYSSWCRYRAGKHQTCRYHCVPVD